DRSRPHQPAVQRGEAHAQRRRRAHRGASGSGCTGRGPGARRRQRSGDPAGRRATHLRPLLSGARQKAGWQWTGLGLLQARGRALLIGYVIVVMLLAVVIQLALPLGGPVLAASYIFGHGVKETIYLVFWVYAGNLYSAEQSKRLFPIYAGAVLVGKIIGAPVATLLTGLVHAEYMIGASAAGFAVVLVMLVAYRQLPEGKGRHVEQKERGGGIRSSLRDSVDGYRAVASDGLLRSLGVNVF